jgi:hypothetical protein
MRADRKLLFGTLVLLIACLGLGACGITAGAPVGASHGDMPPAGAPTSGANANHCGGIPPIPSSPTVTIGTVIPVARATVTGALPATPGRPIGPPAVPTVSAAITPGQVTLTRGTARYSSCDRITAVIANGLTTPISAADHQTNCTLLTLQQAVAGGWQPEPPCRWQTPTRLVTIPANSAILQELAAGSGWPAGTYRLTFTYFSGTTRATVSSAAFTIG